MANSKETKAIQDRMAWKSGDVKITPPSGKSQPPSKPTPSKGSGKKS